MRYGKFLQPGGTVGVPAPSMGLTDEQGKTCAARAKERIEQSGYHLTFGPNAFLDKGVVLSNTPEECGKELTDFYLSKDIDVLISASGGELMCETIDFVDFDRIREADPKWFMGYSDNTNFSFLLTTLCDTAAVYGPNISAIGGEPLHEAVETAFNLLCGEVETVHSFPRWQMLDWTDPASHTGGIIPNTDTTLRGWPFDEMRFSGRLIGGCMDILGVLIGTKYDHVAEFLEKYKEDGFIWFLEACDYSVLDIRRALWQMKNAGWFRYAKGFLFGRPVHYGQTIEGLDQYRAVMDPLKNLGVPIVMDADIGHLPPQMPLISGSLAKVETRGSEMTVKMQLV